MAPISVKGHFAYLVIGGGSGGVASARRAASRGAKTILIEAKALGGTCVNVGCVPKKVMWYASDMASKIRQARDYGFNDVNPAAANNFDWSTFKNKRDAYVKRLNGIYERNLTKEGVEYVYGYARFSDHTVEGKHTVEVTRNDTSETEIYTADKVLIATGGAPTIPKDIPGAYEYGITSDGFFELKEQPKRVAIVGAGYIGVELSGVFNGLNSETHLFIRGETVLRSFDPMIQQVITDHYIKEGVNVHKLSPAFEKVEKLDNGALKITYEDSNGKGELEVDSLIWTIGRYALNDSINVKSTGVKVDKRGQVIVDEHQNSNVEGIYSVGDVVGNVELTPVAIAAGRKLSDRLFGGPEFKNSKQDYFDVPSAVFSHPEIGSIGITEPQAKEKYGADNVKVYSSKFTGMYYAMMEPENKGPTAYKLICTGPEEKVVGLHLVGEASSEVLQGFGVAVRMGATKADFDRCVAIHPTSAEEIVTLR
ncbi:glutathione reductase [Nadsonia fulvescens var. elongata DSM 6958]|uniref:Glutathione reductase n=1 Tax=Nadsonia fulvescens var. elongata DSM 6958 TaxID=857566 RepID=A0A1E3PJN5_9ASCO|nr:glutathione reductase [Nadsonia fulvescens var. elongata DSM 6958]